MFRKFGTIVAVGALALAAAATTPAVAAPKSAATTQPPASAPVEVALEFKGYDKAVAQAHGYTIKTSPQGFEYSVIDNATPAQDQAAQAKAAIRWGKAAPTGTAPGLVHPNGYGDVFSPTCGTAWISGTAVGNLTVDISTGFTLLPGDEAIFYFWKVYLADPGGTSHLQWGPTSLADRNKWSGHKTVGGLTVGNASATVSTESYAVLIDGSSCNAGPAQATYGIN
ncbi:hypothetical protein [Kitasatospora fiedleri]|uniref:hypothetical protein n=1 Tax=Kitasatospora fiedleri TaxID=2991545 RepID=UPI00249AD90D|nr:hypothetical protein [Kitasatospora fiedleri]